MTPELSIVLVTYNSEKFITHCLDNLFKNPAVDAAEIIVVDNNSRDKTRTLIENYSRKIQLVHNTRNVGYGAACNIGFSRAHGGFIVFMNPDSFPAHLTLTNLSTFLKEHRDAGAASCKLLNTDGSLQYSCREYPSPFLVAARLIERLFKGMKGKLTRSYLLMDFDHQTTRSVPWLTGALIMVKRKAFQDVAGFDCRFFLYCEDVDLCFRMHQKGWRVYYVPESGTAMHYYQRLSRQKHLSAETLIHIVSLLKFFLKNYPQNTDTEKRG